jgi:hypothetical protein
MKLSRWWAVFAAVATVEVLLLVKLLNSQATIELLLAIGVVTVLLVLTLRIEDLNKVSVSRDGLQAELSRLADDIKGEVKEKVDQLGGDINDLLISTVLDAYEYITLLKISGDEKDDSYQFNHPKGQDLLERLRNRGLIDELGGNSIFNDRTERSIKVKSHFMITERGKRYLKALKDKGLGEELKIIAK